MRPVIHASLQTTPWQSLGTVAGLTAGTVSFRWKNGRPQLTFMDAEWVAGAVIPASVIPTGAAIETMSRSSTVLARSTDLSAQATIVMWSGGIYMGKVASPGPMRGTITWPT